MMDIVPCIKKRIKKTKTKTKEEEEETRGSVHELEREMRETPYSF